MVQISKPDMFGAMASSLCIVHCMVTPLLFFANACAVTGCIDAPAWWQLVDYLFLVVSFIAIRTTARTSTKSWVGMALFVNWTILLMAILNETFEIIALPELSVYIPAFGLIALHLYNQKYCQCAGNNCCSN